MKLFVQATCFDSKTCISLSFVTREIVTYSWPWANIGVRRSITIFMKIFFGICWWSWQNKFTTTIVCELMCMKILLHQISKKFIKWFDIVYHVHFLINWFTHCFIAVEWWCRENHYKNIFWTKIFYTHYKHIYFQKKNH